MSVRATHPDYDKMYSLWEMCEDAADGEHCVHAKGAVYLPFLDDETTEQYKKRLFRTPFFNATWRTIAGLKGMLFRKAPIPNVPDKLKPFLDNIDLAGLSLTRFSNEVAENALIFGRVGLLTDNQKSEPGLTIADQKARGLRSFITIYEAKNIINWKESKIDGVSILTLVVLTEDFELLGKDRFEHKCETRYRVLELADGVYRQQVWRINEKQEDEQVGSDIYPLINNQPMYFIPFIFIGTDCLESDADAPPLIDLVTTNFHHYEISSSYERGCFISGLGTLFIYGAPPNKKDPIYMGGTVANCLSDSQARAEFVELRSEFKALRTNLEDKKQDMSILGARILEQRIRGVESAEAMARRTSGEESILADISATISEGITKALRWLAMFENITGEISYELTKDFLPFGIASQDLTALMSATQAGLISPQTFFENAQRGEIIDSEVTFEQEQERISSNPMITAPVPMAQAQPAAMP
jgi:hypothetical protein